MPRRAQRRWSLASQRLCHIKSTILDCKLMNRNVQRNKGLPNRAKMSLRSKVARRDKAALATAGCDPKLRRMEFLAGTGCLCRLLPHFTRPSPTDRLVGIHNFTDLRPAQGSLALRPAGLFRRPGRPLSRGFDPASCPTAPLVCYQINRHRPVCLDGRNAGGV